MDGPRLYGILIENFRSIDRKVEVRLDAPVVLVHGQNGAGKTSLLLAIELALTGGIPSMERADTRYKQQLLHQGTSEGRVVLNLAAVDDLEGRFVGYGKIVFHRIDITLFDTPAASAFLRSILCDLAWIDLTASTNSGIEAAGARKTDRAATGKLDRVEQRPHSSTIL